MPMKRYKSAARCLCPTRREPRANMRDLNLLSQFSKQCLSKRHICDMQFADVAWALKTQTAINQAWPNAVFGLRPRLFFYIFIHYSLLLTRRYNFAAKLEIPAWRHFLHPLRQRHRFRAKRKSSGSRSPERCGKFLLAYADRSHIDKQGGKKVYPADPLPAGKRVSLRSIHRSGRADLYRRQEQGAEISRTPHPGRNEPGG